MILSKFPFVSFQFRKGHYISANLDKRKGADEKRYL